MFTALNDKKIVFLSHLKNVKKLTEHFLILNGKKSQNVVLLFKVWAFSKHYSFFKFNKFRLDFIDS